MHFSSLLSSVAISLLGVSELVSAHAVFVKAIGSGDEGYVGHGLGMDPANKRDGGGFLPWQKDIPVFDWKVVHNNWNKKYMGWGCGVTVDTLITHVIKHKNAEWMHVANKKLGWPWPEHDTPVGAFIDFGQGIIDMYNKEKAKLTRFDNGLKHTFRTGIPKVVPGGKLRITVWQVNLDGGGPFKCMIDYKAQAQQWTRQHLPVTGNCVGNAYSIRPVGHPAPCDIEVTLPADMKCEGVHGAAKGICIVRCENNAQNGPFGGCVPVQQLQPIVKEVVQTKPVPIVKTVKPVVLPPKAVTVTKNNVITIIQGGNTKVSVITKNSIITVTQVIAPPKTTVDVQIKTVTVVSKVLPTKKPSVVGKPIETTKRPDATEKPTEEQVEAGLGGEYYDEETIEEIKNTPITEEEKEQLQEQVGQKDEDGTDVYSEKKFRFHRD
ncbi:hypothetical protein TWF730_002681 [Orbilia blumenaviensis]|uniref:Uncharacterized protein n=1 Tax=Orbilia blumenaviensis TaxID=1796055 RepID=A0AAV9U6U0_9PEZI